MTPGWIVCVEVEAGKGEIEPFLFAVALPDHREAMAAARVTPEVVSPRVVLGGKAPSIHRCELIAPARSETLRCLNLQPGDAWRL